MLKAREIMNTKPLVVVPETGVEELARLLTEKGVPGAVVLDKEGTLVGVVTESDLIAREKNLHIPTVVTLFDMVIPLERSSHFQEELKRMLASKVLEIATLEPETVEPETPLTEIATIMSEKKVHFLPVVEGEKLLGVVSRREIIQALAQGRE